MRLPACPHSLSPFFHRAAWPDAYSSTVWPLSDAARVDPRSKALGPQLRKCAQDIAHVTFRVYGNNRYVIKSGFFENADTEAGLAGTRHANNYGMRRQILGVIEDKLLRELVGLCVEALAEIESAEFLEVLYLRQAMDRCNSRRTQAAIRSRNR